MVHKLEEVLNEELLIIESYRIVIEIMINDGKSLTSQTMIELSKMLDNHMLKTIEINKHIKDLNKKTVDLNLIRSLKTLTPCM